MTTKINKQNLKRIGEFLYEIPKDFREDMRVPARLYGDEAILEDALEDLSVEQLVNTATLPGVVRSTLAMPDVHQGHGFPIGGVVATELPHGVISPGGVGYDINCGVRLLRSGQGPSFHPCLRLCPCRPVSALGSRLVSSLSLSVLPTLLPCPSHR